MSYTFELAIDRSVLSTEEYTQQSSLHFSTEKEASAFGNRLFEPPQSVASWEVVESPGPVNCQFKDGQFCMR